MTSIPGHHSHMDFSHGSRNKVCVAPVARASVDALLFSTHSSSLCYHERTGWGGQNWLSPWARETLGTPYLPMAMFRASFFCPVLWLSHFWTWFYFCTAQLLMWNSY